MSTGAWHYQEAERLLAGVDDPGDPEQGIRPMHYEPNQMSVRRAHAHATLALAAATALRDGDSLPERDWQAWDDAAGVRKAAP